MQELLKQRQHREIGFVSHFGKNFSICIFICRTKIRIAVADLIDLIRTEPIRLMQMEVQTNFRHEKLRIRAKKSVRIGLTQIFGRIFPGDL